MKIRMLDICLFSVTLSLTTLTAYFRIQGTLVGYQIGDFKNKESMLLDEASRLKMKLAKLTSKGNLTILASKEAHYPDPFEALASVEKLKQEKED